MTHPPTVSALARRALLALMVLTGLMLPRMGAALAEIAGLESFVICRGAEIVTITVGADGAPVEVEIADHAPCLAAALPDMPPPPAERAARLIPTEETVLAAPPRLADALWRGPPPGRAPPIA